MAISFNQIPSNFRQPKLFIEVDNTGAVRFPTGQQYVSLMIGQRLSAGTKAALQVDRLTSADQAAEFYGSGSMMHLMAIAWFKQNTLSDLRAISLDDAGGSVAATGSINFTGSVPTEAAPIDFLIGGQAVQIVSAVGDTGTTLVTKLVAAITALPSLPITAAVNGGDTNICDLTAKNKGDHGNYTPIVQNYFSGQKTPAGTTIAVTDLSGGSVLPDIDTIWPILGETQYHVFVHPFIDVQSLDKMKTELDDRFGPIRQIEGHAFTCGVGDFGTITTFGNGRNDEHQTMLTSYKSPNPPYQWAAETGAIVAFYGQQDAARPFQTLNYKHVLPPLEGDRFTLTENNLMLFDGISTYNVVNGVPQVARLITMYQRNQSGGEDISYLNVNTMLIISRLRFDVKNRFQTKYPRHKLANDGTRFGDGQAIITPSVAKAEFVSLFESWELLGLVEEAGQFIDDLVVERNQADPDRLDVIFQPDFINGFRIGAFQLKFLL